MINQERFSLYALFVLLVVTCGGLIFGYHTAVISGILSDLNTAFSLSTFDQGFLVSIVLLGGLIGSFFGGALADRFGRKKILIITALIYCAGAVIQAASHSYPELLLGRFLTGIGIGLTSVVGPLYLAEVAPPDFRGAFVSTYQLMLTAGILIAYAVDFLLEGKGNWQLVFYIALIPAVLQLIALFFIPETPGWLMRHSGVKRAEQSLDELREDNEWKEHIGEMEAVAAPKKKGRLKLLLKPHLKRLIVIGVLLSIFQQITGINTIIYYAPKIFSGAGENISLLITLYIGVANFLFTFLSVFLIDKLGRRFFLLLGVSAMIVGQLLLILGENIPSLGITGVFIYIFGFAIGLGPITWVLLSEIYPLRIRGKAMGLAIFANWVFNYIVSLTFLMLIEYFGLGKTFMLYGFISLLCLLFIYFYIPETKGKSLEDIELLASKGDL